MKKTNFMLRNTCSGSAFFTFDEMELISHSLARYIIQLREINRDRDKEKIEMLDNINLQIRDVINSEEKLISMQRKLIRK